jgi:hypothetical protein
MTQSLYRVFDQTHQECSESLSKIGVMINHDTFENSAVNIADISSHQLTADSAWNPLEKDGDFCRPN